MGGIGGWPRGQGRGMSGSDGIGGSDGSGGMVNVGWECGGGSVGGDIEDEPNERLDIFGVSSSLASDSIEK